jgi:hypothetical protein
MAFEDYVEQEFYTKQSKFHEKPSDPVRGVRITLEQSPGARDSRVDLWAADSEMIRSIATAVKAQSAKDLEVGAYLTVTRAEGAYQATYTRPEAV